MRVLLAAVVLALLSAPVLAAAETGYPWLAALGEVATEPLSAREPVPEGFRRIDAPEDTLAAWLRDLPVRADRATVHAHDGRVLRAPAAHVVAMDVGARDLQQCADTAIRLLSEFAWARGATDDLGWDFTSGDRTRWADYVAGERFVIGRTVERRRGAARPATRDTFGRWLDLVFTYAGTRSLAREGRAVAPGEVMPGDVFVAGGSPGHAVIVLDVAVHADGRRAALLGQGFMPAQELHVLRGRSGARSEVLDGTWFVLPAADDGLLDTPSWAPFTGAQARRIAPVR